jgi:hypothetical protein
MTAIMDGELEQLGERIAEQAAHLDAAMHRLLADLREFDARGGWHVQGAMSCAHWLAWRVGWDLVTARERVRVARRLGEFSVIDDALRRGEVSYSKVRTMMRVATPANAGPGGVQTNAAAPQCGDACTSFCNLERKTCGSPDAPLANITPQYQNSIRLLQ